MEKHPSPRLAVFTTPAAEVAYVADNEGDAQALARQMGGLVEIRCRIVEEVPFRHRETFLSSQTPEAFEASRCLHKAHTRSVKKKRL